MATYQSHLQLEKSLGIGSNESVVSAH